LYESEKLWKKIVPEKEEYESEKIKYIEDNSFWNKMCCGPRLKLEDKKEIKNGASGGETKIVQIKVKKGQDESVCIPKNTNPEIKNDVKSCLLI
jgi:hypothetical protein